MEGNMLSKLYYREECRQRLIELLGKFTYSMPKKYTRQIYYMVKKGVPDRQIINYISANKNNIHSPQTIFAVEKNMASNKRGMRMAGTLYSFLKQIPFKQPINYLDMGSNMGTITVEFGKKLNLGPTNIHGIDVETFTSQKIVPIQGFTFNYYDGVSIPYENDYFDIVTCTMVLHHIKNVDLVVDEINRVMKKNGILIIKEHDVECESIEWLVYLEHILYDVLDYGVKYDDFVKNYNQYTFNKNSLTNLMNRHGFKLELISDAQFLKNNIKYNPTNNYFAIYIKKI